MYFNKSAVEPYFKNEHNIALLNKASRLLQAKLDEVWPRNNYDEPKPEPQKQMTGKEFIREAIRVSTKYPTELKWYKRLEELYVRDEAKAAATTAVKIGRAHV